MYRYWLGVNKWRRAGILVADFIKTDLTESQIDHSIDWCCSNSQFMWNETWSRLGNSVTGFMISDESCNRFFPTAVTDYWQDKAVCRHEHQRKRQISGLSSMSMVVIVRYFSSGPLLLYTMPWGLQTLKNMMNHTRCEGSYTNDE